MIVTAAVGSGIVVNVTSYEGVNLALSWLWLMGITNAFNLIDNMDGLAAGVVVIVAFFRSGLLYVNGFASDGLLCAVIGVSFLGFLLFNFKPAKIFMGDGGSMMAGFALAALTIHGPLPHVRSLDGRLVLPGVDLRLSHLRYGSGVGVAQNIGTADFGRRPGSQLAPSCLTGNAGFDRGVGLMGVYRRRFSVGVAVLSLTGLDRS